MPHRLVPLASRSAAEPFINSFSISIYIAIHSRIFRERLREAKEAHSRMHLITAGVSLAVINIMDGKSGGIY